MILKVLPPTCQIYLGKRFKNTFYIKERIVRFIYSEQHFNSKNKTLKANFVQFRLNKESDKHELSCSRFELDTLENCRLVGKRQEADNRVYYGLGCTEVSHIKLWEEHTVNFTPILSNGQKNIYHTDIYDESLSSEDGKANTAEINYKRELFKGFWKVHEDDEASLNENIVPFKNPKEVLESIIPKR